MMKNIVLLLGVGAMLSGCNLYGGLSKPSSDPQHLLAARACLDRADYVCAQEHYAALSSSYIDQKISEGNLTTLAQNNIFSMADLIGALGDGRGSGSTLSVLANILAGRGKTTATDRTLIQSLYATANANIVNPQTKAFSKFIAALAMYNSVLGSAAGANGTLEAADLALNATSCKGTGAAGCAGNANCATPGTNNMGDAAFADTMATAGNWGNAPSVDMLIAAADAMNSELAILTGGSSSGLLGAVADIINIAPPAAGAQCKRYAILSIIFP